MLQRVVRIFLCAAMVIAAPALAVAGQTHFVANNGVDGPACGAKESPCRSISQAIANAEPGGAIVVGPGRYGAGIDTPAVGCGCVLAINKPVDVLSSNGAAATVIDGHTSPALQNVLVITVGARFGKPGRGFTVTNTANLGGGHGIVLDAAEVEVRGNQVIGLPGDPVPAFGILTLASSADVLIEGNQVVGWPTGIGAFGLDTTVRKNVSVLNGLGIDMSGTVAAFGNVLVANSGGISASDASTAIGNAALGNTFSGVQAQQGFTGVIQKNNFMGNTCGVRHLSTNAEAALDASRNYWGAASGPGPAPADAACTTVGPITVAPFATGPFKARARIKP